MIICIDPGPIVSGAVVMDGMNIRAAFPEIDNIDLKSTLRGDHGIKVLVYEMIACYGMPVGREVFETCVWIGRFCEAFCGDTEPVYRRDAKIHLCDSPRAKDANVRQAIIDKYEPAGGGKTPQVGTKAAPGPLYGVSKHAWAALAVGLTFIETREES